jgi:hypothetical protein
VKPSPEHLPAICDDRAPLLAEVEQHRGRVLWWFDDYSHNPVGCWFGRPLWNGGWNIAVCWVDESEQQFFVSVENIGLREKAIELVRGALIEQMGFS